MRLVVKKTRSSLLTTALALMTLVIIILMMIMAPAVDTSPYQGETFARSSQLQFSLNETLYPADLDRSVKRTRGESTGTLRGAGKERTNTQVNTSGGDKPEGDYTEARVSTRSERDRERKVIARLIADRIMEYYFKYDSPPGLYRDKSKTELTSEPAHIVYLYEGNTNRIDALAVTTGRKKTDYTFSRVHSCSQQTSTGLNITFIFNDTEVILCKEDGGRERMPVMYY